MHYKCNKFNPIVDDENKMTIRMNNKAINREGRLYLNLETLLFVFIYSAQIFFGLGHRAVPK